MLNVSTKKGKIDYDLANEKTKLTHKYTNKKL